MHYVLIPFLFAFLAFARLDRLFFKANASFCPKHVIPNWSRCPQYTTPSSPQVDEILNQQFTYLTKGKQSFVFVSEDQKWVIKLVRLPRYAMRYSRKGSVSSISFLSKTLEGCKWAYEALSEETGVVYAHLGPTDDLHCSINLIDQLGRKYSFSADSIPFVVQKFGKPFFPVFDAEKNPTELIEKTVQLFSSLYDKGFIDRDSILDKNFGVIDTAPFIIDIGQLEKIDTLPPRSEYLLEMTHSLGVKLLRESPQLYSYYKNLLH